MSICYGNLDIGTIHELKTDPAPFDAVVGGWKKFEIRKNDRDFKPGDKLLLQEYDRERREYTGRCHLTPPIACLVKDYGLEEGYVCLGWQ